MYNLDETFFSFNRDAGDGITSAIALKIYAISLISSAIAVAVAIPISNGLMDLPTITTTQVTTTTSISTTQTTSVVTTTLATTTTTTTQSSCTFPCICTSISPSTLWQTYSSDTIYMTISTASCNFTRTPLYFTSMAGTSSHWSLGGYNAIFLASNNTFTVHVRQVGSWTAIQLMNVTNSYAWNVNWMGIYN